MYLVCPACSKRLQIPDDKLPTDQAVRLTCPACQERFAYDPRAHRAAGGTPAETSPAPPMEAPAGPPWHIMTDPNVMQALVCLDDAAHQEACRQTLQALGYAPDVMPNQFQALEYLRQVPYRLFVLDAAFDGTSLETNLVLTFLRERPLDRRRYQFVVLCAPDLTTALTSPTVARYWRNTWPSMNCCIARFVPCGSSSAKKCRVDVSALTALLAKRRPQLSIRLRYTR